MGGLRFLAMTLAMLMAAFFALPSAAQENDPPPHVKIRLVAETERPAPGGEVALAFVSTPMPGWHGYWLNPGDAGIPTTASWTLPEGVTAGALRFPLPERLLIAGLMNYVYEHPFAQLVTLKLPAGLAVGSKLPVKVTLDYLVCTDKICVPEKTELSTELTVGDGSITAARRTEFDKYRALLPRPLAEKARYQVQGEGFRLAVPFPASAKAADVYFYPVTDGVVDYAAPQKAVRDGDRIVVDTKARGSKGTIEGVLGVGGGRGFAIQAEPGDVAAASASATPVSTSLETPVAPAAPFDWSAALLAFAGAVLGGLLLNIMPCVFPILSLKALSLAKANEREGSARAEALAYAAGVILVCVALGAILLGLRAAGSTAGWAFQLQDPRVILVLLLLVMGIALNLAGLFEMSAPGVVNRMAARGTGGAFMTGALAAFIATPCTGPFMGAALGAALVLPAAAALAVFAGLGLGIALPFLLIGFVPALRRRLPKPGPWMVTLRHILSIPMFLTALALAWVLGRQAGVDGMTIGLGASLLAALGLWWIGRRQARGASYQWLPALPLLLLALAAVVLVKPAPPATAEAAPEGMEAFSEARLAELTGQGRPVFAYFTADWCLTCKVNEKAVIETVAVRQALADNKVAVLVGDWTDGDPALGRFIEKHNRAGVPLYLWYRPGEAAPRVLPQILTQDMMRSLAAGK